MASLVVAVAVLGAAVNAIQFFPQPTKDVVLPPDIMDPKPTPGPLGFVELHKRQNIDSLVVQVAPDNTCGFVSGSIGAAYTCNTKSNTCVIVPSTAGSPGLVGCCDFASAECGFRQTCVDFNQVSSLSLCTGACLVDTFTVKCLSTAAPFCNTVSFPGGAFDFFCNSVNISTALAAETTFSGETDGRSYLTLTVPLTGSTTGNPFAGFSSLPPVTVTATSSSSGSAPPSDGGGSNVGAIVGGVVGGVAVIALIILGVWLLMRRNRKDKEKKAAAAAAAAQQQQPGQPMGQSPGGAAAYGPMAAQHTGPSTYGDNASTIYDASKYNQQPYAQGYSPPPQNGQQGGYGQPGTYFDPNRADSASPNLAAGSSAYNPNRVSMQTVGSPTPSQQQFVGNPQHVSMQSFTSQPGAPGPIYGQHTGPQQQPYAPGQPTVHEVPDNSASHHRGQMHELA